MERARKRPVGITLLAVCRAVMGLAGLALLIGMVAMGRVSGPEELSRVALVLSLNAISLAAVVGLWRGRKWGWWLSALFLLVGLGRNAVLLVSVGGLPEEIRQIDPEAISVYLRIVSHIVISGLILLYHFMPNVNRWFEFPTGSWKLRLGIVLLAAAASFGVHAFIS